MTILNFDRVNVSLSLMETRLNDMGANQEGRLPK